MNKTSQAARLCHCTFWYTQLCLKIPLKCMMIT